MNLSFFVLIVQYENLVPIDQIHYMLCSTLLYAILFVTYRSIENVSTEI